MRTKAINGFADQCAEHGTERQLGSYPGSTGTHQVIAPVNPANGAVVYRLMYPGGALERAKRGPTFECRLGLPRSSARPQHEVRAFSVHRKRLSL